MWPIAIASFVALFSFIVASQLLRVGEPQKIHASIPWIRCAFQSGDLIFASRKDPLFITRLFGRSFWTHVALIFEDHRNECLYVWESTVENNLPLSASSHVFKGPKLTPLFKWLDRTIRVDERPVAVRALRTDLSPSQKAGFSKFVSKKLKKYRFAHDFLMDAWRRYWSWLPFLRLPFQSNRRRYCASLVGQTLEQIGIVERTLRLEENYVPGDFADDSCITYCPGVTYGPLVELVY